MWLVVPPVLLCLLDFGLTLYGQSDAYWLAYRFHNYQACNALFLVTALVVVMSFKRGQCHDGSSAFNWRRTGLPEWMRWVALVLLMAWPIWIFLVPH
jgi:hypothetical protein